MIGILLVGAVAVVLVVGWFYQQRPTLPISNPDPGEPGPNEGTWAWFDHPHILGEVVPPIPECGVTYPLIYTDIAELAGGCSQVAAVLPGKQTELLGKARSHAKRYCIRHPDEKCQGIQELDHSFSNSCFQVDDVTYLAVTVTYLFKCADPGPPVVYTPDNPPPPMGPVDPEPPAPVPDCSGTYHYVAHDISELADGCAGSARAAVERQKHQRLLDAAEDYASTFCQGAANPLCRISVAHGFDVSHHCFRSDGLGASYHTSTIVYFFSCPMTA